MSKLRGLFLLDADKTTLDKLVSDLNSQAVNSGLIGEILSVLEYIDIET